MNPTEEELITLVTIMYLTQILALFLVSITDNTAARSSIVATVLHAMVEQHVVPESVVMEFLSTKAIEDIKLAYSKKTG